jgi:c-di-GMP-binding flagellar brake protein YcgR
MQVQDDPTDRSKMDITGKSARNRRQFIRQYSLFKIPVYDGETRRFVGLIQDISTGGMQLFGVKAEENQPKTLIVQASQYLKSGGIFRFDAICRWSRRDSPQGYHLSGFEFTNMDEEARSDLEKLIDFVTLG